MSEVDECMKGRVKKGREYVSVRCDMGTPRTDNESERESGQAIV